MTVNSAIVYFSSSRVSWRSATGQGFSLEYKAISLHAVSRDLSAFPHQCLYLMLDTDLQPGNLVDIPCGKIKFSVVIILNMLCVVIKCP